MSGQDEPNRAMWLATRAGKMEPSSPLGITRCIPQEKFSRKPYFKSFIDQVCSVKMAGYWPRSFLRVYGPRAMDEFMRLGPWTSKKKNLANIQPSWPHLVNNPYVLFHALFVVSVVLLFLFLFNALLGENCPQLFWRSDMQGHLNTNDFRKGFWVSGFIFLSWKHQRNRHLCSSLLCMEKRSVCFFLLGNKGNQKPNISSCLTSSEVVMNCLVSSNSFQNL